MGNRAEGLALALLRVALGLLWLQDLILPRLAVQSWTAGSLGLDAAAGWLLPSLEVGLVVTLLTGLLVRVAGAVGAALAVTGAVNLATAGGGPGAPGVWAVALLAVVHAVLLVGGAGSWGALDAVRRTGDAAQAAALGRSWGLLALTAGVAVAVLARGSAPLWTAQHVIELPRGLLSLGTWDLPGALVAGGAGLVLLIGTAPRMSPMVLVALLVAGGGAVLVVIGVLAGGVATASLLAAVAVVAAVCAPHLQGAGGGGGDDG
ncbi:hypothetical protein SAMN06264364_11867 [Quadrisphaera granulorum]|uniref:Uncharacterized protein n=1 Tax=Quadrisphaera granulorum TaxID=317664 RepID=A0A316A3Y9_9ACTN|nr:hypothetical protein [Quadrisphaera granulorum]PWJ52696.1 hypothetical protein BXY45_11867 [Quadrisphaera granulorum]SZE97518.1 hypothetical protein SAMN06264364_11867 [Quadrisphaera granulorum]